MQIQETYRKFPIKFYQKPDGTIHYENKFLSGDAKTLDDAFKVFKNNDWDRDLIYYYDDVTDVEFGAFTPAYTDRKYKGMKYLGQIELRLDIDTGWGSGEHSVTYLSEHPEAQDAHAKYIKKLKREEQIDNFKKKLKQGFKKVAGLFKPQYEMFDPYKTRYDLICEHCGEIIPTATYYEEYHKKNYHLECIWDKLYNETNSNDYQDCREFFFSLQKYIGNWPNVGLDIQEDYETDLELVKINDRKLGLQESAAAMYKSNKPTFKDFYDYVIKNPKAKKSYFEITKPYKLRIPSDTILHDYKKHEITFDNWNDCLSNLNNIINASISKTKIASSPAEIALCRILGKKDFGVSIQLEKTYNQIMTIFIDHPNTIDNWIKTGAAGGSASQLQTSDTSKSSSVTQSSQAPNNIITYIKEKIKG